MPKLKPGEAPSPSEDDAQWRDEFDDIFSALPPWQRRALAYLGRLQLERERYPSADLDAEIERVEDALEAGVEIDIPRSQ